MKNNSEIKVLEAINFVRNFSPVKIILNDVVLYNDYDDNKPDEDGVCGEHFPPLAVIPERLRNAFENWDNMYVDSVDIKIVHHHHSIVYLTERKADDSGKRLSRR